MLGRVLSNWLKARKRDRAVYLREEEIVRGCEGDWLRGNASPGEDGTF